MPIHIGELEPPSNTWFLGSTRVLNPNGISIGSTVLATVCKTVRPMLPHRCHVCLSVLSVRNVGVLWPNGWMDHAETSRGGRPRPRPHCVDGDPAPRPPTGHSPQFSAHVCCGQTARCIKMSLGMEVGLGPGHIVLDGDPAPPPQRGTAPNFRSMFIVANGRTPQALLST